MNTSKRIHITLKDLTPIMSSELERLVALVTCANVYLQGNETKFNLEPTITEYCHGLEFIEKPIFGIAGSNRVIAADAKKWFTYLKGQGVARVRLHYSPSNRGDISQEIMDDIVECGGDWLIENQYSSSSHLYVPIAYPGDKGIGPAWKTYFARLKDTTKNLDDSSPSVLESRITLDGLLETLSNFAQKFEYSAHWSDNFDRSREILEKFEPSESDDFIPRGLYSKEARQLLQAVLSSWVFGGMGSWNDLAFNGEDGNQYTSLTHQLYETICRSISSVTNSYP